MNSEKYLKDIYKDFFGEYENNKTKEEIIDVNFDEEIQKLYISDESKELLKKIVSYILNYNSDKRYIPFNISIVKLTDVVVENIRKIITSAVKKSKYLKDVKTSEISLYKLEENTFNNAYNSNDIVVIKDINGLELESINDKQKYMHLLEECIDKNKNITLLISNNEEELNNIFTYNKSLKDKYFVFKIKEIKEEKSVVYNDILSNTNLDENLKIKLLDYISNTYDKSELDSETYKNSLINYLLLNNDVPLLKEQKTIDEIFKDLND